MTTDVTTSRSSSGSSRRGGGVDVQQTGDQHTRDRAPTEG